MSRRCWSVSRVLAELVTGAVVAVLALQPWTCHHAPSSYPNAAVAANGHECASIGRSILEQNGSAVDAAIATLFCEGLGCAQCMGLGGGFLATVYDAATGEVKVLNARERAPAATHENMFINTSSTVGGLAIAVPGELRGYGILHQEYGRLPWEQLVKPAADLCRKGFRVTSYMGRALMSFSDKIKAEPSLREIYVNPDTGEVWKEGDKIVDPALARTLDVISREGSDAIHSGSLSALLAHDIRALGGRITENDLKNYRAQWQKPIKVPLSEDYTLYSVPLPGSGSILAFILNMLSEWVGPGTNAPVDSDLYWHRTVEAFKFAYAKRTNLGDPSRRNLPFNISKLEHDLIENKYAESHRQLVKDTATNSDWKYYGALFENAKDHGTAQIVVVAPDGSAISVTSTINYIWGCQRRSRSLGIVLNNEMDDFAVPRRESGYGLPPSPANMLAPELQPLSSMVPSMVLSKDRKVELVLGAAGGTKITSQVALMVRRVILEEAALRDAITWPRLHHQLMPMLLEHEPNFSRKTLASLREKGHVATIRGPTAGFAAVVAIARDKNGDLIPATDHRRLGSVDGF